MSHRQPRNSGAPKPPEAPKAPGRNDGKERDLGASWRRSNNQGGDTQPKGDGNARGPQNTTAPYTSTSFGGFSPTIRKPKGTEPIFSYSNINFVYNGDVTQGDLKKWNSCIKKWVDDYVRKDGPYKGTVKDDSRKGWPEWKPEYGVVSSQGPHITNSMNSDRSINQFADKRIHLTLWLMSEKEWNLSPPQGVGLHIYVDGECKYIPKRNTRRTMLEPDEQPHLSLKTKNNQMSKLNCVFIAEAKERFKNKTAILSEESEGKATEEQAIETPRLTPKSRSTRVFQNWAGYDYWKEVVDGKTMTIGVVKGQRIENFDPDKGKLPVESNSSTPASASATAVEPQSTPASASRPTGTIVTSQSSEKNKTKAKKPTKTEERTSTYSAAVQQNPSRSPERHKKKAEKRVSAPSTTNTSQNIGREKKKANESIPRTSRSPRRDNEKAGGPATTIKPRTSQSLERHTTRDEQPVSAHLTTARPKKPTSAPSITARPKTSQETDKTTKADKKVEKTASISNTTGDGESSQKHKGKNGMKYKRTRYNENQWIYLSQEANSNKWKKIDEETWKKSWEE